MTRMRGGRDLDSSQVSNTFIIVQSRRQLTLPVRSGVRLYPELLMSTTPTGKPLK